MQRLLLLMLREGPAHGYGLAARLDVLGVERRCRGRIYPALRWLDMKGLVTAWWHMPDYGSARRMYELGPTGLATVERLAQVLATEIPLLGDPLSAYVVAMARCGAPDEEEAHAS